MNIKKNVFYNMSYQLLIAIYPLITVPYVSKALGSEFLGIYSYTYTVAYYFSLVCTLGITLHGNRSIAVVRDDKEKLSKVFWGIFFVHLAVSVLTVATYLIYCLFIVRENRYIALLQGLVILSSVLDITWLYFGMELFKATIFRNLVVRVSSLILIVLFINSPEDLALYTLIVGGTTFIGHLCLWTMLPRYLVRVKISKWDICRHIVPLFKLFIPVIAVNSYMFIDKIMLGKMCNMNQVGYYENAEKLVKMPTTVIGAIGNVMLSRSAYLLAKGDKETNKKYVIVTLSFVMMLVTAFMIGLCAIAPELVPWYMGDDFLPCISLIILLTPIIGFMCWGNVIRTQNLIPNNKDGIYIKSVFAAAIINFIANYVFIPKLGAYGAVIGTLLSEGIVCAYQTYATRKDTNYLFDAWSYIEYLFAGSIMYIFIRQLSKGMCSSPITSIIQILSGGIIYFLIIFILHFIFRRKDRRIDFVSLLNGLKGNFISKKF